MPNKKINPTGNKRGTFSIFGGYASGLFKSFPPPLRSGGNAALSGRA
jgi:hypothetical protein